MAVNGEFPTTSGDGQITAKGAVFGRLDVRAASLRTGIGKRDEHLRSPDFFDASRSTPDISVVVTDVTATGERSADLRRAHGPGTTRPLPLSATVEPLGDGTVRISAQTTRGPDGFGVSGNMVGMMRRRPPR